MTLVLRNLFTFAALAGSGVLVAASCRDVVDSGEVDTVTELCAMLVRCGDLPAEFDCGEFRVLFGDRTTDAGFLGFVDKNGCFDSCAEARSCRGQAPICIVGAQRNASSDNVRICLSDVECCGALDGTSACEDGGCCLPFRVECDDDDVCCGDVACQEVRDLGIRTCGGVPACKPETQACQVDGDCCSSICADVGDTRVCIARTCTNPGQICVSDEDCCDISGVQGVCGTDKRCALKDDSCISGRTPCTPGDPEACCGDVALVCFPRADPVLSDGEATGVCAIPGTPLPIGFGCALSSNCQDDCDWGAVDRCCETQPDYLACRQNPPVECTDPSCQSTFCQKPPGVCAIGESCEPATGESSATCESSTDCCSGRCAAPQESAALQCVCAGTSCFDPKVASVGAGPLFCDPLDAGYVEMWASCAVSICELDPFCCCSGWDALCVSAALACP